MITKQGVVVKISGQKTTKVEVNEYRTHPKYKKQYRKTKNFLVHDEKSEAQVDDLVTIQQVQPISKKKSWSLISINKKAA